MKKREGKALDKINIQLFCCVTYEDTWGTILDKSKSYVKHFRCELYIKIHNGKFLDKCKNYILHFYY